MARNYLRTMFGPAAEALQQMDGSREPYARMTAGATGEPDPLGERERLFVAACDSFYLASNSETGWPYVQHRGGPKGFLKLLDAHRLAFDDYPGNRQHISAGNVTGDDRVSLFLMDYPNRRRLKIIGHARTVDAVEAPSDSAVSAGSEPPAARAFVVDVVGFDWNCPKYIEPRFTEAEIRDRIAPMMTELLALRAEVAGLREKQG